MAPAFDGILSACRQLERAWHKRECVGAGTGSNGLSDNTLTHGASLPPMTPRPPPGGMVLPNAFGLMSMKSFKRSSSSKGASAQVRSARHAGSPLLRRGQRVLCGSLDSVTAPPRL